MRTASQIDLLDYESAKTIADGLWLKDHPGESAPGDFVELVQVLATSLTPSA